MQWIAFSLSFFLFSFLLFGWIGGEEVLRYVPSMLEQSCLSPLEQGHWVDFQGFIMDAFGWRAGLNGMTPSYVFGVEWLQ